MKKKRIEIPSCLYKTIAAHKSKTEWEDTYTTPEEKILLRFWFLIDHGITINQKVINTGVLEPEADLWAFVKGQGEECSS